MDKTLKYSILRYSPSLTSGESINLGIIFYEEKLNHREFRFTKDLSRLAKFDDEINVELVEKLMWGIKEEVESEVFDHKIFDIDEYTRFYINAFCFGDAKTIKYDVLDETIKYLDNTYLQG